MYFHFLLVQCYQLNKSSAGTCLIDMSTCSYQLGKADYSKLWGWSKNVAMWCLKEWTLSNMLNPINDLHLNVEHEFHRDAITTFASFLQHLAATILIGSRCFVKSNLSILWKENKASSLNWLDALKRIAWAISLYYIQWSKAQSSLKMCF